MMNKKYAEGTSVSIERSQNEIKRNLNRHGATGFLFGEQGEKAAILFELKGRQYRMGVTYPPRGKFQNMQPNQYTRVMNAKQRAENAYEQEKQRLWRGLALLVKAKLEAIESGISTLEMEMQPYTVMPSGQTAGEWLEPQIERVYKTGKMPPLLPGSANHKMIETPYIEGEVV